MKVANRDGGVNSWKKRGLNAIKPWMKQPRDRLCAVHRATPSPQVVKHVAKGINVRRRTDRRIWVAPLFGGHVVVCAEQGIGARATMARAAAGADIRLFADG